MAANNSPQNPFKQAAGAAASGGKPADVLGGEGQGDMPKPECWPAKDRPQQQSGGAAGRAAPQSIPAKGPLPMVANVPQQSGGNPPTNQPGNKPGDASPKPYKLKGA